MSPVSVYRGQYWNVILAEINPAQHTDCANYLFADGHADKISAETFSNWVEQDAASVLVDPNNATNLARPNQQRVDLLPAF